MRFLLSIVLVSKLGFAGTDISDLSEQQKDSFRDIAAKLRCPTCQGLSVNDSDAKFSIQIQDRIAAQIREGKNEQQILQYFSKHYGPWILREPPKKGFNLLAWAFPIFMLTGGPLGVWFFVWRKRQVIHDVQSRSVQSIAEEFKAAIEIERGSES